MIEARRLSKQFGPTHAVIDASFEAQRGEILGVLGPNGAGKTTTLRMICAYLSPTAGTALVDGIDVVAKPLEARTRIGYLPENVPLYPEMRVIEYLRFRAGLKQIERRARNSAIDRALQLAALRDRARQTIGTLSRGYRQRVGLADALLASPPLLVLDEPTVGLDPNQVIDTRQVINDLKGEHTILLSSHILSEVEQLCDRVAIFQRGRVIAQDSPQGLQARLHSAPTISIELPAGSDLEGLLAGLGRVAERVVLDDGWERCLVESAEDLRETLFRRAAERGIVLRELSRRSLSLEQIFHELTATEGAPENEPTPEVQQ